MQKKPRRWLEFCLLIVGVALLAIYSGMRIDSHVQSRAGLGAFERSKMLARGEPWPTRQLTSKPVTDFSLWSTKRIQHFQQSQISSSEPPSAILRIPKLNLEAPVLEGTDEVVLNRGVGRIMGTARPGEPGNVGIAGHRDGFFRGLKDIAPGDVLELETINAKASYVVDDIEIVEPSDTSVLAPRGKPAVTLVTCYPFYFVGDAPQRYIVHAAAIQVDPTTTAEAQPGNRASTQSK
jgi:sortase A